GPGVHCHWIDVVQESDVRADLLHVVTHVEHDRDGAQSAEDAANTECISNGLLQAITFWDLEVDQCRWVAADLDHIDGVVGSFQGSSAILRSTNLWMRAKYLCYLARHDLGDVQAFGINVHQGNFRPGKFWKQEDVSEQVQCEDNAAGADKSNLWHNFL